MKNIEKYKSDLQHLIDKGEKLDLSIRYACHKDNFEKQLREAIKDEKKVKEFIENILPFNREYQSWYSESLVLVKQLMPDRRNDFVRLYEKPKTRKAIEYGNYVMEDYLQNLTVNSGYGEKKVGPDAAISQFEQQLNILKSLERRFESSLFDIRQLVQADLFDSELDSARELNKNKFSRGAGAIAGVVLEKHLSEVLGNHNLTTSKKNPSISDFNDILKNAGVYDTPNWRKIQLLGDIRNLCDHNKTREPKQEEVDELISGVEAIIKTIF
ncbi:hypothetical protein SAMN04487995_1783 [Dyadobacter koreensis]|uniref:HEPN domain-containing protein n=1 Tax=Dyadobacter koreensis TaxID=408657 RepID=A0A1H6T1V5_9BACT|nr:hypothetical protein [Dyadobacter koreensis]SEI70250.1 hypothetical protein SAMN04487995_1783 [Dyadobacter koreensis]